jgi:hypothetical protein
MMIDGGIRCAMCGFKLNSTSRFGGFKLNSTPRFGGKKSAHRCSRAVALSRTPPNIHIHARLCHDKALMDVIPRRWWAKLIVTRENEMMRAMLIAECCEPHGQKELMILPSTEGASITS